MISLSRFDITRLKNSAKVAQAIENRWVKKFEEVINQATKTISDPIQEITSPDFEKLFVEHWFNTQIEALTLAERETELEKKAPKLAARPKTLADILRLYDAWRVGRYQPSRRILKRAKDMKEFYIKSVQKAWKKYSEDFRYGGHTTQEEIKDKVRSAAKTSIPRAQTIVRTETTRYYNQARKDYYDKTPDVTHYLFLAIRDKATTPWCAPQVVNGKRGRSGLVYAKDDPLLKAETPPVHWNCRSELLPLNRFNPSHKKMIANPALYRRNHSCTPLPPEWTK